MAEEVLALRNRIIGLLLRGIAADDAYVFAGLVDQTDVRDSNRVIDPGAGWLALWRGSHRSADVRSP